MYYDSIVLREVMLCCRKSLMGYQILAECMSSWVVLFTCNGFLVGFLDT